MKNQILQFGTSRFLQAHADLFVHEAREAGQDIGPITVVKTTHSLERAGRVAAFGDPSGYQVRIRGLSDGALVERSVWVRSVVAGLDAHENWPQVQDEFVCRTAIVICNVGEAGYAVSAEDIALGPDDSKLPAGFPAKLLRLLLARFYGGALPLLILPCELISENGKVLRGVLRDLAITWKLDDSFLTWLGAQVNICNTLVDRIVSEPLEPIGAITEPYALWAIEASDPLTIPFSHPAIVVTDDLTPFLRLKLHILNLGHSFLAQIWMAEKHQPDETVREILNDPDILMRLTELYRQDIVPGFTVWGMRAEAQAYVISTLERFRNPYLNHRLSDIFHNHALKVQRRGADFLTWVRQRDATFKMELVDRLVKAVAL
ncbi:MAG: mannitol dehydrogenase family protein [Alphaproteobacteria bacterium]|nr:mannitol dehydrogenase family protein [Alphaproteobacteria bacterium]